LRQKGKKKLGKMSIVGWFLPLIEKVDPSRLFQDMQIHFSGARRNEPWWRHKSKSKTSIPLNEKILILAVASTVVLLCIIGSIILIPWILGW
jgi:hypothetical protein